MSFVTWVLWAGPLCRRVVATDGRILCSSEKSSKDGAKARADAEPSTAARPDYRSGAATAPFCARMKKRDRTVKRLTSCARLRDVRFAQAARRVCEHACEGAATLPMVSLVAPGIVAERPCPQPCSRAC